MRGVKQFLDALSVTGRYVRGGDKVACACRFGGGLLVYDAHAVCRKRCKPLLRIFRHARTLHAAYDGNMRAACKKPLR